MLHNRLVQLWHLVADFSLLELGNDFFLFKCDDVDTLDRVLMDGPWVITSNYVAV